MQFFTIIPDAQAIVHSRGVYRQVPLYQRGNTIYAKHGGGYIRLSRGGGTSHPNVKWADIDTPIGKWTEGAHFVEYAE
jgi:hypothetical protein